MSASDPLPDSNAQWVVLFDAVRTVVCPKRPVAETYFEFGSEFGSRLKRNEIQSRFLAARQSVFATGAVDFDDELNFPSSDEIEKQLWFDLVHQVFFDVTDIEGLFDSLWNHYAHSDHWMVYDDVPACLAAILQTGAKIGLASNFDSRLAAIVMSFSALQRLDWICYSSMVGYRKPDPRFYQTIESRISDELKSNLTPRFFMVGDQHANDVLAPARLGWTSIHLDRDLAIPRDNAIATLLDLPEAFAAISGMQR